MSAEYAIVSHWHCPSCDVGGRDADPEPSCWNCGGPGIVTSRPRVAGDGLSTPFQNDPDRSTGTLKPRTTEGRPSVNLLKSTTESSQTTSNTETFGIDKDTPPGIYYTTDGRIVTIFALEETVPNLLHEPAATGQGEKGRTIPDTTGNVSDLVPGYDEAVQDR